jgi:hypothetical protein
MFHWDKTVKEEVPCFITVLELRGAELLSLAHQ